MDSILDLFMIAQVLDLNEKTSQVLSLCQKPKESLFPILMGSSLLSGTIVAVITWLANNRIKKIEYEHGVFTTLVDMRKNAILRAKALLSKVLETEMHPPDFYTDEDGYKVLSCVYNPDKEGTEVKQEFESLIKDVYWFSPHIQAQIREINQLLECFIDLNLNPGEYHDVPFNASRAYQKLTGPIKILIHDLDGEMLNVFDIRSLQKAHKKSSPLSSEKNFD